MYSDQKIIGAVISAVLPGSPADLTGVQLGMQVISVDGRPLRDLIDWLWLTDEFEIELQMLDGQTFWLERQPGQTWGIEFAGVLFDGLLTCVNNCVFCFMKMLPKGLRSSLYARDDDYRLSFLHGNFVTLTNLDEQDVSRIAAMHLSPLHVSLQAVTPEYRQALMGQNQARGMEVLQQLLAANIEFHAQVVLMPGQPALAELQKTLEWVEARPGILSLGVVPYGYTRFAKQRQAAHPSNAGQILDFELASQGLTQNGAADFDAENSAQAVLKLLEPFQRRARERSGRSRFMAADEFYLRAYPDAVEKNLPPSEFYDNYPQYEDGIGMLRSWLDDAQAAPLALDLATGSTAGTNQGPLKSAFRAANVANAANTPNTANAANTVIVTGEAFAPFLGAQIDSLSNPQITVLPVKNNFFGGNVDVAGLLTAQDVILQAGEYLVSQSSSSPRVILPGVMFNDDGLTLDDQTAAKIAAALNCQVVVVDCNPQDLLEKLQTVSLETAKIAK